MEWNCVSFIFVATIFHNGLYTGFAWIRWIFAGLLPSFTEFRRVGRCVDAREREDWRSVAGRGEGERNERPGTAHNFYLVGRCLFSSTCTLVNLSLRLVVHHRFPFLPLFAGCVGFVPLISSSSSSPSSSSSSVGWALQEKVRQKEKDSETAPVFPKTEPVSSETKSKAAAAAAAAAATQITHPLFFSFFFFVFFPFGLSDLFSSFSAHHFPFLFVITSPAQALTVLFCP